MNVVLSFFFNHPFIVYFLKKNYSLRQNTLKIWGFERSHSHQSQLVFIWILLELGLDWEQAAQRNLKIRWRSDRTLHQTLMSSVRSVHRRWIAAEQEWPDTETVFSQRSVRRRFNVRSIMKTSRQGDLTLAASDRCPPDASGRDSRGIGPLWNRLDAGWQRPIAATGASGQ